MQGSEIRGQRSVVRDQLFGTSEKVAVLKGHDFTVNGKMLTE
jgi:hypothetical protein